MATTTAKCPQCGVTLSTGALGGLCPACLLKQGAETKGDDIQFEAPTVAEVRRLFPQFEIIELLARGGMGAVYKVRQPALDRIVALKLFPLQGPHGPAFVERFNREARALAKLSHPNIVAVHEFGQAGGFAFFIMEFVDGLNLRELERIGRLSPREALKIVPQICEALQFAHDEGIVHRDIKPENILLDKKGRVKIADFGIAKIMGRDASQVTETEHIIGTPHYMAPEQVEKPETVDHRADIYSLGVVFYEMLTGELPLGKFAPPSRKVEVDVRLDQVVLRALEKEPERRYQRASHVKTDVEMVTAEHAMPIRPKTFGYAFMKAAAYALAVIAGAIVLWVAVYFFAGKSRGDAGQLTQEGWQLWQARQWDQAIVKFRQAVKADPNHTNAWNGLGWASFNSGKWPEAEQAFQKVITMDGKHPGALNGAGQLYLNQGKFEAAEEYLRRAAPQSSASWFGLARLYLLQRKFDQAEAWAQKVVASGQGDAMAEKMLAAARAKELPEGLRLVLEPPSSASGSAEVYGVDSLPPVVVTTEPVSGSRDVAPGPTTIRVSFSKGMMPGTWSWSSAWSNSTPQFLPGGPRYEADGRTCALGVSLEPGRTYAFWLNSDQFKNFRDMEGRPAVPYLLIFETKKE